jgi:hypothetical protein
MRAERLGRHVAEAAKGARRALEAGTAEEVRAIAAERLRAAGLRDHPDIGGWLAGVAEAAQPG